MSKKSDYQKLRDKAWKAISYWVRFRSKHAGRCYSCGRAKQSKELDCGHYIHSSSLDFIEDALRPQCTYCNRYLHGNLAHYAENLIKEIGMARVDELRFMSKQIKKWTREELEGVIKKYAPRKEAKTKKKKAKSMPKL